MNTIKERMELLLAGIDEADEDELVSEWIHLEPTLSIAQLLLLLKIAVQDGEWMLEPVVFDLCLDCRDAASPPAPLSRVAFLPRWKLQLLAGQAQLEELGLICVEDDGSGCEFRLTPRGAHALSWWIDALSDLGFIHDELKAR